ncbi:MAG TPA: hypothetical protein VF691_10950 [Cytophagaceae bacterium]|jgi:uncharacterized protein YacL
MTKRFNRYAVIIITILLAELIHAYALSFVSRWKDDASPYKSVAISMLIAVLVFYPAFKFMEKFLKGISNKYMLKSKKIIGKNLIGSVIGFLLALFLLFLAFSAVWYGKNPIIDLREWISAM